MESILDMMAYCLWPRYDDHVFAIMLGTGSNGKSTLINLITHMVGVNNYSSVTLHDLTTDKYKPALLEGKLVNICAESSGEDLNSAAVSVLKALSAGDAVTYERKYAHAYQGKNTAKLFFAANSVPKFAVRDAAIKRRLLVLPFDYHIKEGK
jgi:putative DNA primase/helicase